MDDNLKTLVKIRNDYIAARGVKPQGMTDAEWEGLSAEIDLIVKALNWAIWQLDLSKTKVTN